MHKSFKQIGRKLLKNSSGIILHPTSEPTIDCYVDADFDSFRIDKTILMKTELKVELTMFYPRSYSTMEAKYVVFPWL